MNWFDAAYPFLKGPFANLWPLLAFPALAGLFSHFAAGRLAPTRADWRVAAALAATPGLVMLTFAVGTIWRTIHHPHYDPAWQHLVKYQLTATVAALILGWAIWRAWRRGRAVDRLARMSRDPGERLAAAARATGVEARQLACADCECFVAGWSRPMVYVSRGTIDRLSDAELRAALRHERAHIDGHDPRMLAVLCLLRDLAPGSGRALTAYLQARERRADAAAAGADGAVPLASALLALARGPKPLAPALGMVGSGDGIWRLHAILGDEQAALSGPALPFSAVIAIAAAPRCSPGRKPSYG